MRRRNFAITFAALLLASIAWTGTGCKQSSDGTAQTSSPAGQKKFYWIQPLKSHAVHQLTQTAFRSGCEKLGYACEVIGTENADQPGTVALAEQVMAKGDAAGFAVWASDPVFYPFINEAGKRGIPVVIIHFPTKQSDVPNATALLSGDPAACGKDAANFIGKQIDGKGSVAITQGNSNTTEDLFSTVFTDTMKQSFPNVKVRTPDIEGFDAPKAIAIAAAILRSDPTVVAALTTTGGEPPTWPGAEKDTGKKIVNVGVNYTRANLDAVKDGSMTAILAQPLWDESYRAAEVLDNAIKGKKPDAFWVKIDAPLVTKDGLGPYYEIMDKADAARAK